MILFKEWHMKAIQNGEKTQTRRIWKESYSKPKKGSIHQAKTCLICKEYYFAKLEILDVYQERLGDITPEDALKEGGYTVEEFKKIWIGINGEWNPDLMVWVVEFKSVPDLDLQPGDKVRMTPECAEYTLYRDKVWTCRSPSFRTGYNEGVFLEDFSGYFSTKFLELVRPAKYKKTNFLNEDAWNLVQKYENKDLRFLFNDINGVYGCYTKLYVLRKPIMGKMRYMITTENKKPIRAVWEVVEVVESEFHNIHYSGSLGRIKNGT